MEPRDIVDAYLEGRINSWGVYRRLLRLGLTTATALTVAGALPGAVRSAEFATLAAAATSPAEAQVLDALISQLASQLGRVAGGGPVQPLATTLARLGANNANLLNTCDRCNIPLNVSNDSANLNGWLNAETPNANVDGPAISTGNLSLQLNGNVGRTEVNLVGLIEPSPNESNGVNINLGNVNLNLGLTFRGETTESFNLNGNLANLQKTPN